MVMIGGDPGDRNYNTATLTYLYMSYNKQNIAVRLLLS